MKKCLKPQNLPSLTLALSGAGFVLRALLYRLGVDGKVLIKTGHPLEILLWLAVAAAVALVILTVRKLDGSARYKDNFRPSTPAAVGAAAAAIGIGLTILLEEPAIGGKLGTAWKITGILSFAALAVIAKCRWEGKSPFFLLHTVVCVFFAIHMVSCYRGWSGNPQLQDYVFSLFGCVGLMLFAYYQAAFDVELGNRRMQLAVGLLTVFCCFTALSGTDYTLLYLTGGIWAYTNLCRLRPVPVPKPAEE